MPRRFSSGSRSVSLPVSARTSHVLPWSMWPAVPIVSGTASTLPPRLREPPASPPPRRSHGGGRLLHLVVAQRPAVEQETAVAHDPDQGRVAEPERRGELLLDGAGAARELLERQRPAAHARDRLLDGPADGRGEALGAGAHRLERLLQHAQHGDLAPRAL